MISQPSPFSSAGQTVQAERSDITVSKQGGAIMNMPAGTKLTDVVKALNALGALSMKK